MLIHLTGVLPNGAVRGAVVGRQALTFTLGTDNTIQLALLQANGTPLPWASGVAVILSVRDQLQGTLLLGRQGTIADEANGIWSFAVTEADLAVIDTGARVYDVTYTAADGNRDVVVPATIYGLPTPPSYEWFLVQVGVGEPGEPVTVPEGSAPLGQGPQGPTGPTGSQGVPGLTWRGAWNSMASYVASDAVSYADVNGGSSNGLSSFRALSSNSNTPPLDGGGALSSSWSYLAKRGQDGTTLPALPGVDYAVLVEHPVGTRAMVQLGVKNLVGNMQAATYQRTSATLNYYVDAVNGTDSNDGTQATQGAATVGPVQTLERLLDLVPLMPAGACTVIVNLATGAGGGQATYSANALYLEGGRGVGQNWMYRGPQMVLFSPATGVATAALDAATPAQVLQLPDASDTLFNARTQLNFTTAAPGWTSDDFSGRAFLRVKRGGNLVIFEIPIVYNTSNTIVVDDPSISPLILSSDTVEIVRPGAVIQGSSGGELAMFVGGSNSTGSGGAFERIAFAGSRLNLNGYPGAPFDRCAFPSGMQVNVNGGALSVTNCCSRGNFVINSTNSRGLRNSRVDSGSSPINTGPSVGLALCNAGLLLGVIYSGSGCMIMPRTLSLRGSQIATSAGGSFAMLQGVALLGDNGSVVAKAQNGGFVRFDKTKTSLRNNVDAGTDLAVEQLVVGFGTGAGKFMDPASYNGHLTALNPAQGVSTIGPGMITTY